MIQNLFFTFCFFILVPGTPGMAQNTEYQLQVVTCVESIVPNGFGRSRMFATDIEVNYLDGTTTRTAVSSDRNLSKRRDLRIKEYEETKLLNLYNEGGIRFQNLAANDALMTSKINDMLANGWELIYITTGVESKMVSTSIKKELLKIGLQILSDGDKIDEKKDDPNGIFLTRYYFLKKTDRI